MSKNILLFGIGAFLIILLYSAFNNQLFNLLVAILSSIVAATIFYVFQVVIPEIRKKKIAEELYFPVMKKLLNFIEERVYFFEDIVTEAGVNTKHKVNYVKEIKENNATTFTYFNYHKDVSVLDIKYEDLKKRCLECAHLLPNAKIVPNLYQIHFDGFFKYMLMLFNKDTHSAFFTNEIHAPDYKIKLNIFKENLGFLRSFLQADQVKLEYRKLTKSEIDDYISEMKNPKYTFQVVSAQPFLYSTSVIPYLYMESNVFARIIDLNDF